MKEDILQIVVEDQWIYALCKGGKIYRKSGDPDEVTEWLLLAEAPKIQYKKAS